MSRGPKLWHFRYIMYHIMAAANVGRKGPRPYRNNRFTRAGYERGTGFPTLREPADNVK